MKKTYFAPALKVVNVQVQHIMAGSGGVSEKDGVVESVGLNGGFTGSKDDVMGKGGESLWDDED